MKKRLDIALVERGLAESRSLAQALILEGKVRVAGQVERKASRAVDETAELEIEAPPRFVSRGGEKLEGAFSKWSGLVAEGRACIDVGSSTGGFTDCLLQHGAAFVMAVDVVITSLIPPCSTLLISSLMVRSSWVTLSRGESAPPRTW